MDELIALDLALIPSKKHFEELYFLNKKAFESGAKGYIYTENHIPHLTLFQLFAPSNQLDEIAEKLQNMPTPKASISLQTDRLKLIRFQEAVSIAMIDFQKTKELAVLQRTSHELLSNYATLTSPVETKNSFSEPRIDQASKWISDFIENASLDSFSPHITLGFTEANQASLQSSFKLSQSFQFDRLVLAQMGNYCSLSKNNFWEKTLLNSFFNQASTENRQSWVAGN